MKNTEPVKLTTTSESIRKLLLAHFEGDAEGFRAAAREYINEERRKNHQVVARDLERLLASYNGLSVVRGSNGLAPLPGASRDVPKDKERDVPLVEMFEPVRRLDDLVFDERTRKTLDRIVDENRQADLLKTYGARPANRILFCGPPGCGKTVSAEAVAAELYLPLALVRFDAVVSSYLGETAANLRKVFDFARSRPMVVLFDEFDAIGKDRASLEEHGEIKRVVNSFLQILDGFRSETVAIAATNHQGLLDLALWRRFDEVVFFDLPDAARIEDLLLRNLRQIGVHPATNLHDLSATLVGLSHADVERIARDAVKDMLLNEPGPVTPAALEGASVRQRKRTAVAKGMNAKAAPQTKSRKGPAR
ncbi:AAA family ATPase [Paludibaculum fermentans]|uniref:AAA family ATPase n=1 Tax=Paludibaculum fermentans TaxID=1473598 RepID=UPI003EBEAB69